jgi:phosphatidylinositol glycan class B
MSALMDYLTFHVALRIFGKPRIAEAALYMSVVNWFNFAYSTRTISNNFETILILLATLYWPMQADSNYRMAAFRKAVFFVGLSILNRPSAITHWIVPAITLFLYTPGILQRFFLLFWTIIVAGLVIAFGVGIDSWFYGKLTFSWWEFVRVNLFNRIGDFYGVNQWHFHLTHSLPAMTGTMLPLILLALSVGGGYTSWILQFIVGSVIFNSLLPHKEIRFLCPLLPFLMMIAGLGYRLIGGLGGPRMMWMKRLFLLLVLISNVAAGFYFARVHQSGPIAVVDYLRGQVDRGSVTGVYFAMPCHSTPFYAHLHRNVPMSFVTCEPPVGDVALSTYKDESDRFYEDPAGYLYKAIIHSVSHVVLFEELLGRIKVGSTLKNAGYHECWRTFNAHLQPDARRSGDILVYCR